MDDCFLDPQNKGEAYYTRGRQNNCDVFYISQSYFRLPRHTIRENMNFLVLFSQDVKNLSHIYADHCDGDMTLDEFKSFCQKVWSVDHHFVVIDLTSKKGEGKYRKNLDTFYFPIKMSFLHIKDPQKREQIVADRKEKVVKVQREIVKRKLTPTTTTKPKTTTTSPSKINRISENVSNDLPPVKRVKGIGGTQFLPGDVKGLQTKLHYLLAEYRAGNTTATRNQIVSITDELLRRKKLSRIEYNHINDFIQKEA